MATIACLTAVGRQDGLELAASLPFRASRELRLAKANPSWPTPTQSAPNATKVQGRIGGFVSERVMFARDQTARAPMQSRIRITSHSAHPSDPREGSRCRKGTWAAPTPVGAYGETAPRVRWTFFLACLNNGKGAAVARTVVLLLRGTGYGLRAMATPQTRTPHALFWRHALSAMPAAQ